MCFLAWPFVMAWGFIGLVFSAVGRLLALRLGAALVANGALLCVAVDEIAIGVSLIALGVALMVRAIC